MQLKLSSQTGNGKSGISDCLIGINAAMSKIARNTNKTVLCLIFGPV